MRFKILPSKKLVLKMCNFMKIIPCAISGKNEKKIALFFLRVSNRVIFDCPKNTAFSVKKAGGVGGGMY